MESIAACALQHYNTNISKGKPKDDSEWTVYAAIVAEEEDNLWVVSSATGTKCTAIRKEGFILHDSHAEILARRGFVRVLWHEVSELSKNEGCSKKPCLLEQGSSQEKYRIRKSIKLHLYISDSPCGDASIYGPSSGNFFTGAKIVVSKETGITATECGGDHQLLQGAPVARENSQVLSSLRTKSGRSNLPVHLRSNSMCCSDKIVKWCVLGLQGSLLSNIVEPVMLSSVVVSQDPRLKDSPTTKHHQLQALERAITSRAGAVWDCIATKDCDDVSSKWPWKDQIPSVHVVRSVFPSGKSALAPSLGTSSTSSLQPPPAKKTKLSSSEASLDRKISPCGFALNWQCTDPDVTEILVGVRGICQGKKPRALEDYKRLSSRLSRQSLCQQAKDILSIDTMSGYQALKASNSDSSWKLLKEHVLGGGPLSGWLQEKNDFSFKTTGETGSQRK